MADGSTSSTIRNAFNTLISGSSGVTSLNAINHAIWLQVAQRRLFLWAEWVHTEDIPLDTPSRGDFSDPLGAGWIWDKSVVPSVPLNVGYT